MALPDHLADLERKVSARFSEALAEIRLEMRRAVQAEAQRASSAMLSELEAIPPPRASALLAEEDLLELAREAGAEGRRTLGRSLRAALVEFDRARTQNAVLEALLASARPLGDHAALWLMRPQEIVGWASHGYAGDPVAGRTLAHTASPALARLATGRGCVLLAAIEAAQLADALEIAAPARALFVPLVLRDRVAAALYLDAASAGEFDVEALQVLALAAAQRLELQALATRSYTPTLYLDGEAPASERGLALWDPAAPVAGGSPAAAPAASAGDDDSASSPAVASVAAAAPTAQAAPAPAPLAPPAPEAEPPTDWMASAEEPADEASPAPTPEFEPPAAEEEPATLAEPMPTLRSGLDSDAAAARPEPVAEEIAWQLEEVGESPRIETAPSAVGDLDEFAAATPSELPEVPEVTEVPEPTEIAETAATPWLAATPTHEIPLQPPAPDLAAAERFADAAAAATSAASEWREVEETTAPHATYSPAATQRFPAVTNEFLQPDAGPPAAQAPATPEPALSSAASTIAFVPALQSPSPVAPDLTDDATVHLQRAAPPAPPPAALATPPGTAPAAVHDDEPTVSRARTTEVAPPSDLQGPGWAFSSMRAARSTGDNALHEEARRLARLLVSEIKLYNEDQVEEGRHNRDIYHRLKDDIDRSRQIYEERVHESVRGTTDYFQQELIRSLAGGDPRALGI